MTERGESIVLIGFMGAGKSSVGRRLEERTGLPRFDTDEMIVTRLGLSILQIFEVHGENVFRQVEDKTLREFNPTRASIIVTGGGSLLRAGNADLLRHLGFVVYLMADEETLFQRASKKAPRPLLRSDDPRRTMTELLHARLPLYEKTADMTFDTSRLSHDEVADLILHQLEELRKNQS